MICCYSQSLRVLLLVLPLLLKLVLFFLPLLLLLLLFSFPAFAEEVLARRRLALFRGAIAGRFCLQNLGVRVWGLEFGILRFRIYGLYHGWR